MIERPVSQPPASSILGPEPTAQPVIQVSGAKTALVGGLSGAGVAVALEPLLRAAVDLVNAIRGCTPLQ